MGSTFYDGGNSEMQSSADGGLQTLYLMNPTTTYVPYSDVTTTTCTSTPNHNMLLLNLPTLSHAPPPPPPHQHQHLLGLTIPTTHHNHNHSHQDIPSFHYNLWPSPSSILDHHPTPSSPAAAAAAAPRPTTPHHPQQQQALSLSLSGHFNKPRAPTNGGDDIEIPSNWSVVLGSKYLKAAQEVLDEVVNVGKAIDDSLDMDGSHSNNNKDMIIKSQSQSPSNNITADPSTHHHQPQPELTTAQTQELQMKKSKLVHMLDEVEQRYRQYRQQMQIVICSLEQAAGYGAAKSYTAVALRTISKQFRCLKDAISSQIKATSKSLGEDYDCLGGKIEGSRLRYVDHHLRQQRALQQLGMIQHNAWRPQRGLPERAVSILRAWLFEHFLHPYPKDSDKVMLAKQTGLTRSQVSNWFINARVRLWKPMVEEMYLEETKEQQGEDQEQNINNNNNGASNSTKDISSKDQSIASNNNNNNMNGAVVMLEESSSRGGGNNNMMMMRSLDQMKALQSKSDHHHHHQRFSINNQTTNNNSSLPSSSSSNSGMGLMGSAGGGVGNMNNVSVMDVEMKPANNNKYISVGVGTNYAGFSMQDIGRFNINNDNHTNNVSDHHQQQQQHLAPRFHGNGVSLTLGLPHSNDHHNQLPLSLSATQHGFLSHHHHHHRNIHFGSNNNNGSSSSDQFCAITATPQSSHHNSAGTATYDNIDIQNTKNFAAQLLPDFVT